jgi:hypothetical protein
MKEEEYKKLQGIFGALKAPDKEETEPNIQNHTDFKIFFLSLYNIYINLKTIYNNIVSKFF